MLIIIMTRDRYLEYGLMRILSGYQVTTGRELLNAGKVLSGSATLLMILP